MTTRSSLTKFLGSCLGSGRMIDRQPELTYPDDSENAFATYTDAEEKTNTMPKTPDYTVIILPNAPENMGFQAIGTFASETNGHDDLFDPRRTQRSSKTKTVAEDTLTIQFADEAGRIEPIQLKGFMEFYECPPGVILEDIVNSHTTQTQ
ncbi:hypothetical protein BD324DRAFT_625640 [Kockovaella imperatae]|uniref:Uncharacterized protein n=1 Tax=Kockovaella imperatae TaxID=4999 RepID=A0A1Y1UGW7_9TREE|nr:hypothetical protein BD324DRAFT_625640 [Kockovaella imperatae]ORX37303.1 hypothetical protein BD324DRAFT_625640 [Kockovaella imperatae]